jgi:Domain of unknown function (DUF4126)
MIALVMETLLSICLGIALAAACGLRIFLPLFALSLAAKLGVVEVSGGFAWLAGTGALITFAVALALEITAYYVPWLDNLLDAAAAPLAVAAGVLSSAAVLGDLDPLPRWILAVVAGGGAAAGMQGLTTILRAFTSFATAGLGNFLVATGELALSALLSVLAFVLPVVAALISIGLLIAFSWEALVRRPAPVTV